MSTPSYEYYAGGQRRAAEGNARFDVLQAGGWGRTGPERLADFSDLIWINSRRGKRELPF
jgi:hypothetical protein